MMESTTQTQEMETKRQEEEPKEETKEEEENEPFLKSDEGRYVMFPIQHVDIWKMYEKQVECFWRAQEIELSKDYNDWTKLTSDEKFFVSQILAYFAASDGLIVENLAARFLNDVQNAEARAFYGFQIAMENIHSETYSLLIDSYIQDPVEKMKLLRAIQHFPCIRKKSEWAQKWIMDKKTNFATRLIAFACIEGIFFSGAFCSIFWLKKRGLMPGLTFSNELISRDEALHTEFAVLLYSKLLHRLPQEKVFEIVQEAVTYECMFICESLPCRLIGMNKDLMQKYIRFVADRLLTQLGYEKLFHDSNPFDFMEMISLEGKSNMFERKISEYSLASSPSSASLATSSSSSSASTSLLSSSSPSIASSYSESSFSSFSPSFVDENEMSNKTELDFNADF